MTEFKNTAHELRLFRMRLLAASVLVLVCFSLLLARFLWLQVVRHDAYAAQAEENRISVVPIVPNRGLILDRNGVVLARNYSAYTLEITPSKIKTNIDDLIDELGTIVEIQQRDRRRFRRLQEESKNFESVPIRTRLTDEEVAKFTAQRYRFPGVEVQARLFRQYPYGKTAAHVIGYIGRISQRDAERIADSDDEANYNGTDYIGKEGLEKSYESQLHGTTGYEEVEISASGRAVRSLSRTPATPGKNLILSIDIELQKVVEEAFGDQKGALVAINPATGDILAYVSQPSYDPNLFVEGIDQQSWDELNKSPDRPLLNRPLSGLYSPGSTYKPFMALAALELGKRRPQDAIRDPGYFILGNHRFRDDKEGGHGVVDMYRSVVVSCDTYYYMLANDMGVNAIHDFMKPFGFGQITGIDLEHEKRGILPSTEWKRTAFRKPEQKRWIAGDTVSLGIGQGYNSFTPLQLAQATSILANNGVVMKPHLVKIIEDGVSHERTETVPKESYRIPLKQENIDFIKRAMVGVVKEGTGAAAFRGAPYESGGKTGTAQVVNIAKNQKYDSKKLSRIYHDNGLYIGFAPADAPRIAIAAVVENGGWGAGVAAPLVRKAMDYFMLGKRPNEPIKSVAPEAVSPDTPVEGPTSDDAGSSNTPTVQPDVQE
ncbi:MULTISPECIES: penicillin-binding protein 2 [Herbaspirillum]|uniref:Peptidoglycan D,D-transpeptidase MrdA n=1 Tax=Herbaspirillum aquaticum TaxID=568783 RepID=A0A225ST53_9BURK|nr:MULTISPECIES: penicillin-binding protein 2 [Herbaspirillum]MRT32231.1 penicillin-binding protein 2 [Herbaspirillum sp. CAH-3]OWY34251.1 penicillin-binding protein 2 [Herbaspirillum aquaticum]